MAMQTHNAFFDILAITSRLESVLRGVTAAESHLFAYLSCLLALYRQRPIAEWGYSFTRTEWGTPFATALADATEGLVVRGFIADGEEGLRTTPDGKAFVQAVSPLSEFNPRIEYLEGACSSALVMSPGDIRDALHAEPGLYRASIGQSPRLLLDDIALDSLYDHFLVLSEIVGASAADLMVPSTVWLSYLSEIRRQDALRPAEASNGNPFTNVLSSF